jgi:hypothetical protein
MLNHAALRQSMSRGFIIDALAGSVIMTNEKRGGRFADLRGMKQQWNAPTDADVSRET